MLSFDRDVNESVSRESRHPADEVISVIRQAVEIGAIGSQVGNMVLRIACSMFP